MAFLDLIHLRKQFGATQVVEDFTLSIEAGEFVSFLGPSGCGKTTVLRMVAGFETPSAGSIEIEGRDVVQLRPNQRNIGMVFQAYALFPNMTVAQNVAFGLKVAGQSKAVMADTVRSMLALVKLEALAERYPFQLSGGQQQRVALARALAVRPRVLLLDEPLSALDAKIRVSLREEIRSIQRQLGITTIFVTHDQEEALSLSDRIVVMHQGRVEQVGTPFAIYNQPATRFVASFVGTVNVLEAELLEPLTGVVRFEGQVVTLGRPIHEAVGTKLALALRPEALSLDVGKAFQWPAQVQDVSFLGSVLRVRVQIGSHTVSLDAFNRPTSPPPAVGSPISVGFAPEDVRVLGA